MADMQYCVSLQQYATSHTKGSTVFMLNCTEPYTAMDLQMVMWKMELILRRKKQKDLIRSWQCSPEGLYCELEGSQYQTGS